MRGWGIGFQRGPSDMVDASWNTMMNEVLAWVYRDARVGVYYDV